MFVRSPQLAGTSLVDPTTIRSQARFENCFFFTGVVAILLVLKRFKARPSTLISLTKNLVYKNIEAQMWKKIRTIIRTSPASKKRNI